MRARLEFRVAQELAVSGTWACAVGCPAPPSFPPAPGGSPCSLQTEPPPGRSPPGPHLSFCLPPRGLPSGLHPWDPSSTDLPPTFLESLGPRPSPVRPSAPRGASPVCFSTGSECSGEDGVVSPVQVWLWGPASPAPGAVGGFAFGLRPFGFQAPASGLGPAASLTEASSPCET